MKPRLERAFVIVVSVLASAVSLVPAQAWARTQVEELPRPAVISTSGGYSAWSTYDRAIARYRLMVRDPDGMVAPLPVAPRDVPFDVDLGPGPNGEVVAAYSRCEVEPTPGGPKRSVKGQGVQASGLPVWATGRGCDLYTYDLRAAAERKLEGASTTQASEFLPSVWRDEVGFARVYEGRSGKRGIFPYLYVRPLDGSRSSERQLGGSRGDFGIPGPLSLDLYGRRLGFVWNWSTRDGVFGSYVRIDTVGGGHRVVDRVISEAAGPVQMAGAVFDRGRLYYAQASAGARERYLGSYRLSTEERHRQLLDVATLSLGRDQGVTSLLHAARVESYTADPSVPCGNDGSAEDSTGCPLVRDGDLLASDNLPRILSVEYGRHRPEGASKAFYGFRVRTGDPDGQVIAMSYQRVDPPSDKLTHFNGGCGLGGKKTGQEQTWTLLTGRLKPGRYRYRITAESSDCSDQQDVVQSTSRIVPVRVK